MHSSYFPNIRFLLLMALTLTPSNLSAQTAASRVDQAAGMKILESAAMFYRDVDVLCADFTQHLLVPLLGEDRMGVGRLCQSLPNRFAMRFSDPDGDLVILDGAFVWLYYPSLDPKQVFKMPMVENSGHYDFHREFLDQPAKKYHVTYEDKDEVAGKTTDRLRLIPLNPASYDLSLIHISEPTRPY